MEAGVHDGAVVMAHVAMSRIHRWVPDTSPRRLIDMILGLLGPQGTLLVPTFPFAGSQSTYAHRNPVFDAQRTPSALGVLTEVFRVMPGVVRSRHPTHPVAGIGSRAHELLGDHERSSTFGPGSPFHRLAEIDALVIGIGVSYANAVTVFHTAAALHPWARVNAFEDTTLSLDVVDDAQRLGVAVRPLRAGLPYDIRHGQTFALGNGALQYRYHAGLLVSRAAASQFLRVTLDAIDARQVYAASRPWPPP